MFTLLKFKGKKITLWFEIYPPTNQIRMEIKNFKAEKYVCYVNFIYFNVVPCMYVCIFKQDTL